jgi:PilZ domain-containing protein
MSNNRRQFERFAIPEDAIAYDQTGCRLGRVTIAGGGGMTVILEDTAPQFTPGDRLRITVVEPERNIRHTIDTVVRHHQEHTLGLEFVTGRGA